MRNILRVLFLGSLALTTGYAFAAPPTITERPAGGTWVFDGVQYPFVCTFPLMMQGSGTEVTIDDLYGHGIARNFNFFPSFNVTLTDLRLGGRSLTFAALQANGETVITVTDFGPGIPRLGIPPLIESDASLGVANGGHLRPGDTATALQRRYYKHSRRQRVRGVHDC